jgi:hypothetical protein
VSDRHSTYGMKSKIVLVVITYFIFSGDIFGQRSKEITDKAQSFVEGVLKKDVFISHMKIDIDNSVSVKVKDGEMITNELSVDTVRDIAYYEIGFLIFDSNSPLIAKVNVRVLPGGEIVNQKAVRKELDAYCALFRGKIKIGFSQVNDVLLQNGICVNYGRTAVHLGSEGWGRYRWQVIEHQEGNMLRVIAINARKGRIQEDELFLELR